MPAGRRPVKVSRGGRFELLESRVCVRLLPEGLLRFYVLLSQNPGILLKVKMTFQERETGLSLGTVASPQSRLLFHPAELV